MWDVIVRPSLTKSENTHEYLQGTCPTRVASWYTPTVNRSSMLCVHECNSETRNYEALLASFPNETQRTELKHTAR